MTLAAIAALMAPAAAQTVNEADSKVPASGTVSGFTPTCGEAEPAYIMPTTGAAFTLPQEGDPAQLDCAIDLPPPHVRPTAPSLFRMAALPIGTGAPLLKWENARQGAVTEHSGSWDELLGQANQITSGDPVEMVNTWVNWHVRYRDDAAGDEWAPAATTLARGFGDCEDFALAKMGLLLALGVASDDMYLVLLRDRQLVQHAVLAVKRGGRLYILDNRTDIVLPADLVEDYTPILSFSGSFAWTYGQRVG